MSDKKPHEYTIDELAAIPFEPTPPPLSSWRDRALQVVDMYRYGMAMRIHVPDDDRRTILTELYRERAGEKELDLVEIDCATAEEEDFLGRSSYDPSTNSVARDYPTFWSERGAIVLVGNVGMIRPHAVPGIRQVCCLENKRERKKNWVMVLILTPEEQELAFKLLDESGVLNLKIDDQP